MIKEAIILAGGLGTRLQTVVNDVPKSMAPINGVPFIGLVINYLQSQGIQHFIFSLGYKSEMLINFIESEYPQLDKQYCIEEEPLGTGGAIMQACKKVNSENVLVLNGDTLFKINLKSLSNLHVQKKADCTIALKEMFNIERYGTVDMNNSNTVIAFTEKRFCQNGLINGGVYALNVKNFLKENLPEVFSFEKDYLERLFSIRAIFGLKYTTHFIDIGIPEDYERAQIELTET
ncbi:nucleotidyltransferase family protein [Ferruginibacter sp.]|nr:NTP transferase domain-containing protein [Ferruginibacter sp.]